MYYRFISLGSRELRVVSRGESRSPVQRPLAVSHVGGAELGRFVAKRNSCVEASCIML